MKKKNKTSIVIKFYRLEHWFFEHKMIILAKLFYHIIQILFGCSIPYSVMIEKDVDIAHYHGIVLHQKTIIKSGTMIYQNVTIGGRNGKVGAVIGNNCVIGAGACILGDIKVGNNVNIGANAVVLNDVPDNCTVVGVPAKIIKRR